jgi:hypothetical protein
MLITLIWNVDYVDYVSLKFLLKLIAPSWNVQDV